MCETDLSRNPLINSIGSAVCATFGHSGYKQVINRLGLPIVNCYNAAHNIFSCY